MSEAAATGRRESFRKWVRNPFRSWTLRRKLVTSVVALVALLGIVIGLVSVLFLRSYLIERVNDQLEITALRSRYAAMDILGPGTPLPTAEGIVHAAGQAAGTLAFVFLDGRPVGHGEYLSTDPQTRTKVLGSGVTKRLSELPVDGPYQSVDLGGDLGQYRLAAISLPDGAELVIGLPLSEALRTAGQLLIVVLLVTAAAGVLAAAAGTLVVRFALRPLDRVAAAATEVSALPLDRGEVALGVRVPEEDTDPRTEVGRVGAAFNAMLGHVSSALSVREASERKVRQFVSDASHELRTPLASIRGYSELTRRSPESLSPDAERSLGRIESEAVRMTGIVEDLLLLARLDEGRELEREPVDLTALLIDLLSDAHAAGPDHSWSLDLPEEPVEIVGDPPRLHQVFANLLTNARVHTPAGTAVTLGLSREADNAVVTVADDGPGIPPEVQPVLFERFARGDSSRSRATGSTGLGLAIVRAVVDAHNGSIEVESRPGLTRFRVRLPLGAPRAADGTA